jgi:hypothetical protein
MTHDHASRSPDTNGSSDVAAVDASKVVCTNCKVQYTSDGPAQEEYAACPVCGNKQPRLWKPPAAPTPVRAPNVITTLRGATPEEVTAVTSDLLWQIYNVPHVSDASFPRDMAALASHVVPFYHLAVTFHWEDRSLVAQSRPYRGEQVHNPSLTAEEIDVWGISLPKAPSEGYANNQTVSTDVAASYSVTQCVQCDGETRVSCQKCNATGRVRCATCKGSKKRRCRECKGTGEVSRYTETQQYGTCSTCGGRGVAVWGGINAGINRSLEKSGMELDNRCKSCWGRGARTETIRQEYKVPCTTCRTTGEVTCDGCDPQGRVACGGCSGTGRVKCEPCDGRGKMLHLLAVCRVLSAVNKAYYVSWDDAALPTAEVRDAMNSVVLDKSACDPNKWPIVREQLIPAGTVPEWCGSQLQETPLGRKISGVFARQAGKQSPAKRIVEVNVEIRQTTAAGLDYKFENHEYSHWCLAGMPIRLDIPTPLSSRAMALCDEASSLWSAGRRDDATTKARYCIDIAKKDRYFEKRFASAPIADELRAAANSQAWAVYRAASAKRAIAGATAAVKAVSGWVGGLFRKK